MATTALMPTVMAVMNLAIFHRTAQTRFLHQEHHATKTYLIQGIYAPTTKGTDHTPIMFPDIGDISADHSPAAIPTVTEAAVLKGTPCTLLPATAADHIALQLRDAPVTPYAVIPTGIVAPHPTLIMSPADVTHATLQNGASLVPATPKQHPRCSTPIGPTIQKLSPCRIPLQILHQIQTVTLIL